jgi:hypothetical protein
MEMMLVRSHPQLLNSSFCCMQATHAHVRFNIPQNKLCAMCFYIFSLLYFYFHLFLKKEVELLSHEYRARRCVSARERRNDAKLCVTFYATIHSPVEYVLSKKKLIAFFQLTQPRELFSQREIPQLLQDGITNQ